MSAPSPKLLFQDSMNVYSTRKWQKGKGGERADTSDYF